MVDFRKRLPAAGIQKIAEVIALKSMQQSVDETEETSDAEDHPDDAPGKSNLIPKDSDCGEENLNCADSTEIKGEEIKGVRGN